jgi:two-component system, OmpR family, KDP operon response regulator KdpE
VTLATHRILVIEDEPAIRNVLRVVLGSEGYIVIEADTGARAEIEARSHKPDLLLLDLGLPDVDGLDVIRQVRTWSPVPIVVLSARTMEEQKIAALDAGADDYVTKPFGIEELLARVRASLRRVPVGEKEPASLIEIGDFRIDLAAHKVAVRHHDVHLTPKEFDLLVYLARHPGKVVTHRTLLSAIWGGQSTEQIEYLRVFVGQLRKKLESEASSPRYIVTEPWVGYRFEPGS